MKYLNKTQFTIISIALSAFLLSCMEDEGTIKYNKAYSSPNIFDHQHDFSKYPKNFQIVSSISKYDTYEDVFHSRGYKIGEKRIPKYQIGYSDFLSPTSTTQQCTVNEYKKMKVQIGDIVALDAAGKFTRIDPIILKSPVHVAYKPVEKLIDQYVFDGKENPEFKKVFANGKVLDFETYRNKGIQGPIYIIERINSGYGNEATVLYCNEYGIHRWEHFVTKAVTIENIKIGDIVELQWDGDIHMLKKLPMYAKNP